MHAWTFRLGPPHWCSASFGSSAMPLPGPVSPEVQWLPCHGHACSQPVQVRLTGRHGCLPITNQYTDRCSRRHARAADRVVIQVISPSMFSTQQARPWVLCRGSCAGASKVTLIEILYSCPQLLHLELDHSTVSVEEPTRHDSCRLEHLSWVRSPSRVCTMPLLAARGLTACTSPLRQPFHTDLGGRCELCGTAQLLLEEQPFGTQCCLQPAQGDLHVLDTDALTGPV